MLKYSWLLVVLLLWPNTADAEPITAAFVAFTSWFAGLSAFAQFAIRLGASLLLSILAQKLAPRPRMPEMKRDLQVPRSRPPKRFVYGRNRTYGSPAPWRVRGNILYGCIILNSRPSAGGNVKFYMDKREVLATSGDVFDFAGGGLRFTDIEAFTNFGDSPSAPRVWIGLGDQTSPPAAILGEVGVGGTNLGGEEPFFQSTDGWQGSTVMWVRLDVGANEQRGDRWRSAPPEFEVEMDWSLVWDPRDEQQDPDEPSTWPFTKNQSLIMLDSLRLNPLRQYPLSQIHLPSFIEAANVADQPVVKYFASLEAGSTITEPRYEANGVIIWTGGELMDQLMPIEEAGAGSLVRIGGRIGYASGEFRQPLYTVNDFVEDGGIDYQVLRPGKELPIAVKGVYISPERDWQEADLTPAVVTGASTTGVADSGIFDMRLGFVTSATQAMRIQQITARRFSEQRTLGITLWPDALNVCGGSTVEANLPAGFTRLNGFWEVVSANPALWLSEIPDGDESGDQPMALRVPVTLRKTSPFIYEWVPEIDEQPVFSVDFTPVRPALGSPTNLLVETGDGVSTNTQARFRISFTSVDFATEYDIEIRPVGESYALALTTQQNQDIFLNVTAGIAYDVRVRAVQRPQAGNVRFSDFAEVFNTLAFPADYDLGLPQNGAATGGANQISVTFTAPNSANYVGMQFWGSDTDDLNSATQLTTLFGAAGETKTFVETGLGANQTRFYFARSVGDFGFTSAFTQSVSATTNP